MSDIAISVEGLSKSYLVGHNADQAEGYSALRDVIARGARDMARKASDMIRGRQIVQGDEIEEFWALKNVSFEIGSGERVGIIGRNGAGKSTLLKILSRVTEPTKGRVKIAGRVATLLEVGTGFHSELTGRENIFLNGAILGMTHKEIQRKFDEIVDFAEVEKFLDTPVKRYSSGMYVRLAFAVAAHLEPEILIVDEVLAVGDSEFQKKCLGRMDEIGRNGRTVLFVSHNMAMISSLCSKAIHLDKGQLHAIGTTDRVVLGYATAEGGSAAAVNYRNGSRRVGDQYAELLSADVRNAEGIAVGEVEIGEAFSVRMEYRIESHPDRVFVPFLHFYRQDGSCAFIATGSGVQKLSRGDYAAECLIPANFLNDGIYSVGLAVASFESGVSVHFFEQAALIFNVRDPIDDVVTRAGYSGVFPGAVRPLLNWTVEPL